MSNDLIYTGPLTYDATAVNGIAVDLPPGDRRGLRREQPGMPGVVAELATVATSASAGMVPGDAYKNFLDANGKVEAIRKYRAAAVKIAEVLTESEAYYENQREQALSQIVDAVKSTAKRQKRSAVRAPFEATLRYNAQSAEKAVQTRRKKAPAKPTKAPKEPKEPKEPKVG